MQGDGRDVVREMREALDPFIDPGVQFPESVKVISKSLGGLTPIAVTVTKQQFLRAITAIARAKEWEEGELPTAPE